VDSLDTNLLARYYTNDDPVQARIVAALLAGDTPLFVPVSVVIELVWVLSNTRYRLPKSRIVATLRHLLAIATVQVENEAAVLAAVDACEKGMDFADALHLALSARCARLLTFDHKFATRARRLRLAPPCSVPRR